MIKKIGTVGVYVNNQDKAEKFWTEKIGFEIRLKKDMGNGTTWFEVAPKGAESCLVVYPKSLMTNWEELKPSIVFDVENIDAFCQDIKNNGVTLGIEPQDMPWGKFATFKDEDGNEFGLKG